MENADGDNVIAFCSRANKMLPRFIVIGADGRAAENYCIGPLWESALPLIERVCSIIRYTVQDVRRMVDMGQIVPIGLQNEAGDFSTLALVYDLSMPDVGELLAGVIAPDGPWDYRLHEITNVMAEMAQEMDVCGLLLRSPDDIPLRWEHYKARDGVCMLYRFDAPPRQETAEEVLFRMWNDA